MKPEEATLSSLLAFEGNQWHYHIPKFQRAYSWGKNNWNKLLEDIYDNDLGHYMGSVICVYDKSDLSPSEELVYEVVDGQQRLTTLSLLLLAIHYKLKFEILEDDSILKDVDELNDIVSSIRKKILKKVKCTNGKHAFNGFKNEDNICYLRVQPSSQDSNLDDYKFILFENKLIDNIVKPRNCGNRSIYKAYQFFYDQLSDDFGQLKDLIDRLNRISFILISETSHSNAFNLFETLNNRGVPLSGIDIIKNKILSILEKNHGIDIDNSFERWQRLLSNLPNQDDQDRFLRQFYNAFKFKEEVKVEKIPKATSSTLIKIYEVLIKKNAQDLFEDLESKAKIYNRLIEPEKEEPSVLASSLIDLGRVGASASYTFLLYLFSIEKSKLSSDDVLEKVVALFCKYYLRRNVTDFPNTRDLDSINIELIEECQNELKLNKLISYELIETKLLTGKGKPESLDKFKEDLADNLFYYNSGMARYLLAKLDEVSHSREYKPDLWARNEKGIFVWTVEHIFPQGKNIPLEWISMISEGDRTKAEDVQEKYVHCLGNLTLSGYNSKLATLPFSKKQALGETTIFGHKIAIGYQNGMRINNLEFKVNNENRNLANTPVWNEDCIDSRNNVMVEHLLKIFSFKGE